MQEIFLFAFADSLKTKPELPPAPLNPNNQHRSDSLLFTPFRIHKKDTTHRKHDTLRAHLKDPLPISFSESLKIEYTKPRFKIKKGDSATVASTEKDTTRYVPFYNSHLLKTQHTNPIPLNKESSDWVFYVLLFIISAYTLIKVIHMKNLKQIKDAFFSTTISNQIVRDESILFQRASVFLTVIFYFVASLLLYQFSNYYNWNNRLLPDGFARFLVFVLIISIIYSLKLIVLRLVGFIFQVDKAVTSYIFNVFLINNLLGVVLIPLLVCICFMDHRYTHYFIGFAEILIAFAFLYRIFRGITIGLSYPNFSVYYLFLYLCSLEIAPLLFLVKMFL